MKGWERFPIAALLILIAGVQGYTSRSHSEAIRNLNDRIERLEETPHTHSHELGATSHAEPRSPKWPAVRAAWLKDHPTCAACGGTDGLQVHHVISFSSDPSRELDMTNLITLCTHPSHNCHELFGHALNWKYANKHVREDAALIRKHIEEAKAGALAP